MIKNIKTLLFILISLLCVAGCSNNDLDDFSTFFNTEIRGDDSKTFTFHIILMKSEADKKEHFNQVKRKQVKGVPPQNGKNKNKISHEKYKAGEEKLELAYEELEKILNENLYCREGYIELERDIGKGMLIIRGECHESATKDDRKKFINRI